MVLTEVVYADETTVEDESMEYLTNAEIDIIFFQLLSCCRKGLTLEEIINRLSKQ